MNKILAANQSRPQGIAPETKMFWGMFVVALFPVAGLIAILA